ncbi:MAG: glycosyltransferase [Anaerolineae bacterium]
MRILLVGVGSRGDVQPYIALAKGLQQAGHDVVLAAAMNFQTWIESEGLAFAPIHVDMEAYMQTDIGKTWLETSSNNGRRELENMKRMTNTIAPQIVDDLFSISDRGDVFISGLLTIEPLHTLAQAQGKRVIVGLLAPFAPTSSGAAGLQALLPQSDSILNRWFGYLIEMFMFDVMRYPSELVRQRLNQPNVTRSDFMRALNRTPTLIGVSPEVVPPAPDWHAHTYTTGYWFLNSPAAWQPGPELDAFLNDGTPPLYIGFGSMANSNPAETAQVILEALRTTNQRAILHSGWAGFQADDPNVFMLDYAPHDALFPRMAGVIHHGGAGTTAAALRAGVPSGVVAHIGDQWFWGRRVHELGVGAAPMRRHELRVERLATMIRQLTADETMRQQAAALGARIRAEDGVGQAVAVINRLLQP